MSFVLQIQLDMSHLENLQKAEKSRGDLCGSTSQLLHILWLGHV